MQDQNGLRDQKSLMEKEYFDMRKKISICLCIIMALLAFVGCGINDGENVSANEQQDTKLQIVTTIFPAYDWMREILGDRQDDVELTLLLDQGVDMHSYQPTVDDIIKIGSCDLFIYVGGESDQWVEEVLNGVVNPDIIVINLLEELGDSVKEEEIIEGMESGHDHQTAGIDGQENEKEHENDEHVWLSIRNAKYLCGVIADALTEIDEEYTVQYEVNAEDYEVRLDELDAQFQRTVGEADKDTLVFADRFPFRYLTDDYGLEYYAAFPGCEAETEASFETITFLAGKVDELGLPCVLTIDGSDQKIAKTVVSNTKKQNQRILSMNSMQSVTVEEMGNGATYLTVMEKNREVLEAALSGD